MRELSEKLLCPKEVLYEAADGKEVKAHRSVCVSGFCPECDKKQRRFFDCPRHRGDSPSDAVPATPNSTSTPLHSHGPPSTVRWKMFTAVDENGRPTATTSGGRGGEEDFDDEEWTPSNGQRQRAKQVNTMLCLQQRQHRSCEVGICTTQ